MNPEPPTPLSPATVNAALIGCADGLYRAELPDWFEVLVRQRVMLLAAGETRATAHGIWLKAKHELNRRGYMVWEYWDEDRKSYVASCQKRHTAAAERREPEA